MEEGLFATDRVCAVLELKRGPDHTTLWRAFQRLLRMKVLEPMRRRWLDPIGVEEETIAWDRTGTIPTPARADSRSRTGRRMREFRKGADAVGTRSPPKPQGTKTKNQIWKKHDQSSGPLKNACGPVSVWVRAGPQQERRGQGKRTPVEWAAMALLAA